MTSKSHVSFLVPVFHSWTPGQRARDPPPPAPPAGRRPRAGFAACVLGQVRSVQPPLTCRKPGTGPGLRRSRDHRHPPRGPPTTDKTLLFAGLHSEGTEAPRAGRAAAEHWRRQLPLPWPRESRSRPRGLLGAWGVARGRGDPSGRAGVTHAPSCEVKALIHEGRGHLRCPRKDHYWGGPEKLLDPGSSPDPRPTSSRPGSQSWPAEARGAGPLRSGSRNRSPASTSPLLPELKAAAGGQPDGDKATAQPTPSTWAPTLPHPGGRATLLPATPPREATFHHRLGGTRRRHPRSPPPCQEPQQHPPATFAQLVAPTPRPSLPLGTDWTPRVSPDNATGSIVRTSHRTLPLNLSLNSSSSGVDVRKEKPFSQIITCSRPQCPSLNRKASFGSGQMPSSFILSFVCLGP
uniref:proline-rich protein 2-like n=1 Tax=Nyctereutes procyonoides TaxID=34880 RepID=UPI002443C621|nr:proline-rich protein 2-like [Nyctereutes procyonoides]